MNYQSSLEFAGTMDDKDPLASFREQFHYPDIHGPNTIYFCGNSLGLQPKSIGNYLQAELEDWEKLGVEGHFHSKRPWFEYHKLLKDGLAKLTGAGIEEVTPMGSLTTNLHLMLVSFYRPLDTRNKIIMEAGAFPSDQYAIETQCRFRGLDPEKVILELSPKPGTHLLENSAILEAIEQNQEQLALVLLSGVQYYSGQYFDISAITKAAHRAGAMVGWDLAHAIGNVPLSLNADQVDFAVWCSYKYLNSGPGATAGLFVHENHHHNPGIQRFGGWWGHVEQERFKMNKGFKPMAGADGWQLSNANILSMAAQRAALDIFSAAGMNRIRAKSILLTGFMEYLLQQNEGAPEVFKIITPRDPASRGAQLSLLFNKSGRKVFEGLMDHGIVVDWREPDSIRVTAAPLYNSFTEVFKFSQVFNKVVYE